MAPMGRGKGSRMVAQGLGRRIAGLAAAFVVAAPMTAYAQAAPVGAADGVLWPWLLAGGAAIALGAGLAGAYLGRHRARRERNLIAAGFDSSETVT